MRAVDWLLRTILLVLACLATLSLIGALASVSGGSLGDAFPGRIEAPALEAPLPPDPMGTREPAGLDAEPSRDGTLSAATPSTAPAAELARWLKALTYALLALTGFAATGVVALVHVGAQLRRIAER